MATAKTGEPAGIFLPPAEERGYGGELFDELGERWPESGRSPSGFAMHNGDGDSMWIPVADLAPVADMLLREYVSVSQTRGVKR